MKKKKTYPQTSSRSRRFTDYFMTPTQVVPVLYFTVALEHLQESLLEKPLKGGSVSGEALILKKKKKDKNKQKNISEVTLGMWKQ